PGPVVLQPATSLVAVVVDVGIGAGVVVAAIRPEAGADMPAPAIPAAVARANVAPWAVITVSIVVGIVTAATGGVGGAALRQEQPVPGTRLCLLRIHRDEIPEGKAPVHARRLELDGDRRLVA